MVANYELAMRRGVVSNIGKINWIHDILENCIEDALLFDVEKEFVLQFIEDMEYKLQELWNFPRDSSKHTWKNKYLFKKIWYNKRYLCVDTGVEFSIPLSVEENDFYEFGNCFIDVGRMGSDEALFYCRFGGNIEKI